MTERREPTISNLPPEQDEPPRNRSRSTQASPGTKTARSAPPPVASRPVVVRSPLGPLAFFLALLALGGAGYLYWLLLQAQDELTDSRSQVQQTEQRVGALEQRLISADDESTQSLAALQVRVSENASEVRKLWGVAYDRNRTAIATLDESLKQLQSRFDELDQSVAALQGVAGEVAVVTELIEAQQAAISRATASNAQQEQSIQALLQGLDELQGRVGNNEEAINAIDAFRVQVNRQLFQE